MKIFWPLALMAAIFFLSSIPGDASEDQFWLMADLQPTLQNALHIPVYGLLQWLWLRALQKRGRSQAAVIGLAALITGTYGILDEFHQAFVPGRYAAVQDVLLNLFGLVIGTLCFLCLPRPFGGPQAQR